MTIDLAYRRWTGLPRLAVPEWFDIMSAFSGRELLRQEWEQLSPAQRQAVAAADAWADANAADLLPPLTIPGNRLPDEHYARDFARRHAAQSPPAEATHD